MKGTTPNAALATGGRGRVRDRIFDTACDLFYKHGIREVGVDMIATEAGTNKMSFYRSFASKDELVAEYLERKGREFWLWWDGVVDKHPGDARAQIQALFDVYVNTTCFADSRGCAFANASVEIADDDHPGRQVAIKQKAEMRRRLRDLSERAGAAKPDELGDALMLLMEGGYLTRRTFGGTDGPLQTAALTVRVLLDAYIGKAPPAVSALRVDGDRLWSRLMEMAQIGATVHGGCNRQALTDADLAARRLLLSWAEAAGCKSRVDAIGNLFLRKAGHDEGLPVVLAGSHLDTQPTGGKFDGVYGVLAGLEVLEALNEARTVTSHPLEVAVWCNEEGCRFPMAMMGSAVWSGRLPLATAYALADKSGRTVREELDRLGVPTGNSVPRQAVKAALEVHIEQGPVLEQHAKTIGVVTGVQHMSRHEVSVEGQEAHAGPTPMNARRDPVRVLADVLPALYDAAREHGPEARLTVGVIETFPGSPNTVPGRLRFTVDVRHPEVRHYQGLRFDVERLVRAALARHGLTGEVRRVWEAPGVVFDAGCVAAVREASAALRFDALEMVSGAGHDSCNLAAVVPTAMIFVPCAGGLSHNEAESAVPTDLEAGANVLLHAMVGLAG